MNDKKKKLWDESLNNISDVHISEMAQTLYKKSLSETDSDELVIVEEKKKNNGLVFAVAACIVALIGVAVLTSVMLFNGGIKTTPIGPDSSMTTEKEESVPDTELLPTATRIWDQYHPDDADRNQYFSVTIPELKNALIERKENGEIHVNDVYLLGGVADCCESIYLSDLTGDGYPELCFVMALGNGIVDWRIVIIDCTTLETIFTLSDRMHHDYYLFIRDGKLRVKETEWCRQEAVRTGTLVYNGSEISVNWDSEINAEFDRDDSDDSSAPETATTETEESVPPEEPLEELTENEQILKLLYDYGDFIFNVSFKPGKDWNYDIVYEKDKIYVDSNTNEVISSPDGSQIFPDSFCKAKESWIKELRSMITENMEKSFIDAHIKNKLLYICDDEWYLKPNGGGRGYGLGQTELILKSYEKPDENTLVLNFISFGDKEEWGTDEDIVDEGQVILKKSEKGYLIEKCDDLIAEWFVQYSKIKYESEYYYFDRNKVNDSITEVDDLDDGAIAAFKLFYGQEYREITDEEVRLIYERVFGNKLISDESIQNRVNYIGKTMGAVEAQLYNAAFDAEGLDPYNVTEDIREKWFLSEDPPELFSSMEELYEIQKDIFSDITTYEDFLTKFDAFKYEDGKFYIKGRAAGHTRTVDNYLLPFNTGGEETWIPKYCAAVEMDGEIKMAVLRVYSSPTLGIYSVHLAPLTEVDGVLKFPRECDWEKAFGKSK